MILVLLEMGCTDRDIYLFDTFEGMTAPAERDMSPFHGSALEAWEASEKQNRRAWDYYFNDEVFNEDLVRKVLLATGYPEQRLHFVKGTVEQTIPGQAPAQIALLRLDTDWYESTRHELVELYPRVSQGGVLIIDDYGHWHGSKDAVDEYFADVRPPVLFNRMDYSGRIAIKQ